MIQRSDNAHNTPAIGTTGVSRPSTREGYDIWSAHYDYTPNPVVALDERLTPEVVQARRGERVLDAGCGTGRYMPGLLKAGAAVTGVDFSLGMLRVASQKHPGVPLVQADLERAWPFASGAFDIVLCALVGEHLERLDAVFGEMARVLRPGGRAVFSVYHPAMAEAGKEANFRLGDTEYRLGALRHTLADYESAFASAGLRITACREFRGDEELAVLVPAAARYVGFPMLVIYHALRD